MKDKMLSLRSKRKSVPRTVDSSRRRRNFRGFSMIEVLVTMFFLGSVLLSITSVLIYGSTLLLRMEQITIASQSIQKEVELIRSTPFDSILDLESSFTNDDLSRLENGQGQVFLEDSTGTEIKKVTVRVVWTFRGRQMQRDVVTYITRGGINRK